MKSRLKFGIHLFRDANTGKKKNKKIKKKLVQTKNVRHSP